MRRCSGQKTATWAPPAGSRQIPEDKFDEGSCNWAIGEWTSVTSPVAPRASEVHGSSFRTDAGRRRGCVAAEVARKIDGMTLHHEELTAEVGVRELHDQLSRYLRYVGSGGEVVVTMRGRRVARLTMVDDADPLVDLRARGLVREPQRSRRRASGRELLTADGTVSDLVSEQRR